MDVPLHIRCLILLLFQYPTETHPREHSHRISHRTSISTLTDRFNLAGLSHHTNMAPGALTDSWSSLRRFSPVHTKLASTRTSRLLGRSMNIAPHRAIRGHGNSYITKDGRTVYDASCGAAVASIGKRSKRVERAMHNIQRLGLSYVSSLGFDTDITAELADRLIETTGGRMAKAVFYCSGKIGSDMLHASLTVYQALNQSRLQSSLPPNFSAMRSLPASQLNRCSSPGSSHITVRR
jgi:hypothetical protein